MSDTENMPSLDASWLDAYVLLANHCVTCPTCAAVDEEGANLGLPCATADELNAAYLRARRAH